MALPLEEKSVLMKLTKAKSCTAAIPSIASLSAEAAWLLLTQEQRKMLREYIEKAREWEATETHRMQEDPETRKVA